MELSDKFSVCDEVVARELGGETVLLDLNSGLYFGLDQVGGRIWELLSEAPRTLNELCDAIEAEFDAPRARIEQDLLALAEQLSEKELIVAKAG